MATEYEQRLHEQQARTVVACSRWLLAVFCFMSGGTRGKMTTTYSYVDSSQSQKARWPKTEFLVRSTGTKRKRHFGEDHKGISTLKIEARASSSSLLISLHITKSHHQHNHQPLDAHHLQCCDNNNSEEWYRRKQIYPPEQQHPSTMIEFVSICQHQTRISLYHRLFWMEAVKSLKHHHRPARHMSLITKFRRPMMGSTHPRRAYLQTLQKRNKSTLTTLWGC